MASLRACARNGLRGRRVTHGWRSSVLSSQAVRTFDMMLTVTLKEEASGRP